MSKNKYKRLDSLKKPINKFISQEKSGSIVLGISVILALIVANSPFSEHYFHFFENKVGLQFNNETYLNYSIHHWINDGLMAVFFFVVGLELKREMVAGELSNPRKALLPMLAAVGGMIVPAAIYILFNSSGEEHAGWGIPMATDIAFVLGILYLLGDRIPLSLKIFLTALAIVDDLGAVLVIAFFYTSDISTTNLLIGFGFIALMIIGNRMGIRNIFFYAICGILGVWIAFLLSGIHATIAAVLAAFTIPSDIKLKESIFISKLNSRLQEFKQIDPDNKKAMLTNEQLHVLEEIKSDTNEVIPPLQQLEHALHPMVTYIILPIFALANAGVSFADTNVDSLFNSNVLLGVCFGLLLGKVIGIVGFTWLSIKFKIAPQPEGMSFRNLVGLGFLGAIGFTMSLFVTTLAFTHEEFITQAKIGIFAASILGGTFGYILLKKGNK